MKNFIVSLREFFCIESEEDKNKDPMKASRSSMMGSMMSTKKQMAGPGKKEIPQKKVDPGTEFLKKHGFSRSGEKMSGASPSTSGVVKQPPQPGAIKQTAQPETGERTDKPKYRGTFVGQTQTTNGQYVTKPTAWTKKDPVTGNPEQKFGRVQSMQKVSWTWDGNDWVLK